ncbi:hypothetical protein AALA24_13565 [Anaerovoracaceae bacterium 42-11]
MSYITKQKTEVEQTQIVEALLRMKRLNLHEQIINKYRDDGKLNLSDNISGRCCSLNENEEKMIKEWEIETGNKVYHVIKSSMWFGLCYSLLYVSPNVDDWTMDQQDLKAGYPLSYVINIDYPDCSEYGCIGIVAMFGCVVRTV